jgi:hypothetical protein
VVSVTDPYGHILGFLDLPRPTLPRHFPEQARGYLVWVSAATRLGFLKGTTSIRLYLRYIPMRGFVTVTFLGVGLIAQRTTPNLED